MRAVGRAFEKNASFENPTLTSVHASVTRMRRVKTLPNSRFELVSYGASRRWSPRVV